MRRHLVLTSDAARHPFRQMLPPAVLRLWAEDTTKAPASSMEHLRLFLMAYCACFMAVSAFIW
jgi:hypothetical protein